MPSDSEWYNIYIPSQSLLIEKDFPTDCTHREIQKEVESYQVKVETVYVCVLSNLALFRKFIWLSRLWRTILKRRILFLAWMSFWNHFRSWKQKTWQDFGQKPLCRIWSQVLTQITFIFWSSVCYFFAYPVVPAQVRAHSLSSRSIQILQVGYW